MKRLILWSGPMLFLLAIPTLGSAQNAAPPDNEKPVIVPQTAPVKPKIVAPTPVKPPVIVPSVIVPAAAANKAIVNKVTVPETSDKAAQVLNGPVASNVEPPPDKALTLEESIVLALSNHGNIAAAQQGFSASLERITSARAGGAPQLSLQSGYSNQSILNAGGNNNFNGGNNSTTNLVLNQNLFDSGLRGAQTRAARAQSGAALAGVGQARAQIAFNVANSYFQQLRQERLLELAEQQIKVAQDNLAIVRGQIEAEIAAKVDEIPILVELRQREFNRTTAQNDLRTAQVNFRNALGLGRGPDLKIEAVSTQLPPIGVIDEYFAQAQKLNPDLRISRANLQTAQASVEVAKIQAKPRISVDASLAAGIFDSPRRQSGLSAGLNVPIFDGGALRANRRAAQVTLESARLNDEQLAKDVASDLESAYQTVQSANERIAAARSLEEVATSNLQVAQEKYRQGLGTPYEITTAQLQLFNAQISTVQALYDYYLAQAALERATGARSGLNP